MILATHATYISGVLATGLRTIIHKRKGGHWYLIWNLMKTYISCLRNWNRFPEFCTEWQITQQTYLEIMGKMVTEYVLASSKCLTLLLLLKGEKAEKVGKTADFVYIWLVMKLFHRKESTCRLWKLQTFGLRWEMTWLLLNGAMQQTVRSWLGSLLTY